MGDDCLESGTIPVILAVAINPSYFLDLLGIKV